LDLRCGVTYEIDFAVPDLPPTRHPAAIDGMRAPCHSSVEMLSFEKAFEAAFGVAAVLADSRRVRRVPTILGQPVNKAYRRAQTRRAWYRRAIFGRRTMVAQRHGFDGGPAGARATRLAAPFRADNAVCVQLFVLGPDSTSSRNRARSDRSQDAYRRRALRRLAGFAGQCGNQARALNDEVRLVKATCAERPSVKSSKRRISLTMLSRDGPF